MLSDVALGGSLLFGVIRCCPSIPVVVRCYTSGLESRLEPVDVEDTVEVVDFVLEDNCCESADGVSHCFRVPPARLSFGKLPPVRLLFGKLLPARLVCMGWCLRAYARHSCIFNHNLS